MRVALCHVAYRQRGGEDAVVAHEAHLLRDSGVDVREDVVPSGEFDTLGRGARVLLGLNLASHSYGSERVRLMMRDFQPDVVHFHNVFPTLGVGAIRQAASGGAGVAVTLHNFRYSCIRGTHCLEGMLCERCRPKRAVPGIVRGCYRGSPLQSTAISRGTRALWEAMNDPSVVHGLVVLTEFHRARLEALGVTRAITVKPNSVNAGGAPTANRTGVLFVGRLSEEKGIAQLIAAWPADGPTLTVVGDGPQLEECRRLAAGRPVDVVGAREPDAVRRALGMARCLVLPSVWWEGLPTVMLESLAEGTPVVAFDLGAMSALREVGPELLAPPLDFRVLVERACSVCDLNETAHARLAGVCRLLHEEWYSDAVNTRGLLDLYASVASRAST